MNRRVNENECVEGKTEHRQSRYTTETDMFVNSVKNYTSLIYNAFPVFVTAVYKARCSDSYIRTSCVSA